ncbi:MAG: hypothetical protein WCK90_03350 [archaeon]
MKFGSIFLAFLLVFASLLAGFAMVSAAPSLATCPNNAVYQTVSYSSGSQTINCVRGNDWQTSSPGSCVTAVFNTTSPTSSVSCWTTGHACSDRYSCAGVNGACGVFFTATSTNSFSYCNDSVAPNVFGVFPTANTTVTYPANVQIGVNATDANTIEGVFANLTLPTGTVQALNLVGGPVYLNNYVIPGIYGRYNVSFYIYDQNGNVNNSENTFFIVNPPVVPNPINNTNSTNSTVPGNYNQNFIVFNLNLNIPLPYTLIVNLSNSTGLVNSTTLYNASYVRFDNLPSENYTIRAVLINGSGTIVYPPVGPIILDTSPPVLSNINLPSGTYYYLPIRFNVTLNEPGVVWYSLDGGVTNTTMQNLFNFTHNGTISSLANGNYFFRLYWTDLLGNRNTTITTFTLTVSGGSTVDDVIPGGHDNERKFGRVINNVQPEVIGTSTVGNLDATSSRSNVFYYSIIFMLILGILLVALLLWLLLR